MPRATDDLGRVLQSIRFVGTASGAVKALSGFRKGQHSVPDAITPATTAFLAKLCSGELAEEGEQLFQEARAHFSYKRKDLSLDLAPGAAVLSAKDFTYEVSYALSERDASEYEVTRILQGLRRPDVLYLEACDRLFDGRFERVVFQLHRGAPVEQVIDAVESLPETDLAVDYPSDCSSCTLRVPDVAAEVRYDASELAIVFARTAPPRVLWTDFLAVRHAFTLTKETTLVSLLAS